MMHSCLGSDDDDDGPSISQNIYLFYLMPQTPLLLLLHWLSTRQNSSLDDSIEFLLLCCSIKFETNFGSCFVCEIGATCDESARSHLSGFEKTCGSFKWIPEMERNTKKVKTRSLCLTVEAVLGLKDDAKGESINHKTHNNDSMGSLLCMFNCFYFNIIVGKIYGNSGEEEVPMRAKSQFSRSYFYLLGFEHN